MSKKDIHRVFPRTLWGWIEFLGEGMCDLFSAIEPDASLSEKKRAAKATRSRPQGDAMRSCGHDPYYRCLNCAESISNIETYERIREKVQAVVDKSKSTVEHWKAVDELRETFTRYDVKGD